MWVMLPGQLTSLPRALVFLMAGHETKGFHQIFNYFLNKMQLSTPGTANLMAKYHILVLVHKTKRILAVTMELPIICIRHIASASNLAQG